MAVRSTPEIAQRADGRIRHDREEVERRDWSAGVPFHIGHDEEAWGATDNGVRFGFTFQNVPDPASAMGDGGQRMAMIVRYGPHTIVCVIRGMRQRMALRFRDILPAFLRP